MTLHSPRFVLVALLAAVLAGCATETAKEVDSLGEDGLIAAAEGAADSASRPTLVGEIASGTSQEASFSSLSKYLAWHFEASTGQQIVLDARGVSPAGLDTVLILYRATRTGRPTGANLATNDDWGSELSSHIEFTAPETRRYVAVVRRYDRRATGRVSLSLTVSGGEGAACGSRGLPECPTGQYCAFDATDFCGRADAPGTCTRKPEACIALYRPVCGCDGHTYGNACDAASAGVSVESDGACPETGVTCSTDSDCPALRCAPVPGRACPAYRCVDNTCQLGSACGGLLGFGCAEGFFCDWPEDSSCGAADQTGWCTARPEVCSKEAFPVCGCDGVTYSNACYARAGGTDVAHTGRCATPPPPLRDCRTTGCTSGTECISCWDSYVCVPTGAGCRHS